MSPLYRTALYVVTSYACSVQDILNLVANPAVTVEYSSTNHDTSFSFGLCCFAYVPSIFFSVMLPNIGRILPSRDDRQQVAQPNKRNVQLHFCIFALFVIRQKTGTQLSGLMATVAIFRSCMKVWKSLLEMWVSKFACWKCLVSFVKLLSKILNCLLVLSLVTAEHCKCRLVLYCDSRAL
jgi:hypothetical protein